MARVGRDGNNPATRQRGLERFFDGLIEKGVFHSRGEIAAECGMTDAGLSLALSDPHRRLTVEQCLRLARKVKHYPAAVLRVAGREDMAEVLDDLWPKKRDLVHLIRSERELIKEWRQLTMADKHHLSALISILAEKAARTDGRSPASLTGSTTSSARKTRARSR